MLVDAATGIENASIRRRNLLGQPANVVGRDIRDRRRPVRRVALFGYEIAPAFPTQDPGIAKFLVVQIIAEDVLGNREP